MSDVQQLNDAAEQVVQAFLAQLHQHLGHCLISVVLYGSAARGELRLTSDIDLLVIAEQLPKGAFLRAEPIHQAREAIGPLCETLFERLGWYPYISVILKTPQEAERGSRLFLDMVEDAKLLYDRAGFFQRQLIELREKLTRLGARRIAIDGAWYWDLKPDYRWGDVIEL
ncbi:MAG: nucleotidyltransferase domain-containing protein [candidate division NC10 bacterium]|nr:nucleotidyltransferase domain-containing protein [candidate division NC10 bacterium]